MTVKADPVSHIASALYPIPQPLRRILHFTLAQHSINSEACDEVNKVCCQKKFQVVKDSMEIALEHILRNCFFAIDGMYFSTIPCIRNKPTFKHRLCIRIATDTRRGTLSITDLGCGMTRADLINSLGAGRLSSEALKTAKELVAGLPVKEPVPMQDHDENMYELKSNVHIEGKDTSDSICHEASVTGPTLLTHDSSHQNETACPNSINEILIPCRAADIGGFYAALCTLGTAIEVGTKSKFDEYYELEIGYKQSSLSYLHSLELGNDEVKSLSHFRISRPMKEGMKPSVKNGYAKFEDVRGESGTRITITLSSDAIAAGFLDEENVLVPLVTRVLEKSPYHVAFSSRCTEDERRRLIDASEEEEEEAKLEAGENNLDYSNDMDDSSDEVHTSCSPNSVKERSKFIPLRLSLEERKMLRLVEAAMVCSNYTTDVDRIFKSSARRTHAQLKSITSLLRGLVTSCDYSAGQKLIEEENYSAYESFYQQIFEIARRHKIRNPEKMRTEYGKLIYVLQDAVSPSVQPQLSFSCLAPIETVYKFLEERSGIALLDDKLIDIATHDVLPDKKSRDQISVEIKKREKAVAILKQKYRSSFLSPDDIHLCLYSISDNESFLDSNRVPIDKIIGYLHLFFSPGSIEEGYSLSIVSGQDGARLSHSHDRQFYFILQSLTLWRDITDDMFRLWAMAEDDLLSDTVTYNLTETGQGLQRVQSSPKTYKAMQKILSRVQTKVKHWVGSSVIHLGDHNVPNALYFIDKYTQVPRILGPIVACLERMERLYDEDQGIKSFIDEGFGGLEHLKKDILYDFFKSAFDGSGADNFYDAGSCIDGRLTSAWNWASRIAEKQYYCIFKLTGFSGFDGEFK